MPSSAARRRRVDSDSGPLSSEALRSSLTAMSIVA